MNNTLFNENHHALADSIRQQIVHNLIPEQIKLISEQLSLDKKILDQFKDLNPDDVGHVCDLLLGINASGLVQFIPEDVVNSVVRFEAAIQFAKNAKGAEHRSVSKRLFYHHHFEGAVQLAWDCVRSVLGGRQGKGDQLLISAGMILMNMGEPDNRGQIRGNLQLPTHFHFDNNNSPCVVFKDLYDHLHKFGMSLKNSYQGERRSYFLAATTEKAKLFMVSLQPRMPSNHLYLNSTVDRLLSEASSLSSDEKSQSSCSTAKSVDKEDIEVPRVPRIQAKNKPGNSAKMPNKRLFGNSCRSTEQKLKAAKLQKKEQDSQKASEPNMNSISVDFDFPSIENVKTFDGLVDLLPSAHVGEGEKLVMNLSDRLVFKNSQPVNSIIFNVLMR